MIFTDSLLIILGVFIILLGFTAFAFAGYARALFECILFYDSVKKEYGEYYSYELFKSNKDRDNDGKISFMESTFPDDGGHNLKHYETVGILLACLVPLILVWYWAIVYLIIGFWFKAAVFELNFRKYKVK